MSFIYEPQFNIAYGLVGEVMMSIYVGNRRPWHHVDDD